MDIFDGTYDDYLACALCGTYRNGVSKEHKPAVLDELIRQLAPLVGIVFRFEIDPTLCYDDYAILKAEALESLYFLITESCAAIPTDSPRVFTAYMWTTIKRSMMTSIRGTQSQIFDVWLMCHDTERNPNTGHIDRHEDAEIRLYLDQFHDLVLSTAINDIRFTGKEREACILIGKCLLGLSDLHPMAARVYYKLSKNRASFLVSYMEHLLKQASYSIRQIERNEVTRHT